MIIRKAELETVCGITSRFPETELPEIAFAGRSNVGKSSLINSLLNRKSLARTSAQPGKTQTINYYYVEGRPEEKDFAAKGMASRKSQETPEAVNAAEASGAASTPEPANAAEASGAASTPETAAVPAMESAELYLVDLPGYGYTRAAVEIREKWGRMIERYLKTSKQLRAVLLLLDIRHAPTANDRQMYEWIRTQGYEPILIATKQDKIKRSQLQKQMKLLRETLGAEKGTRIIPFSSETKQGRDEVWNALLEIAQGAGNS